MVKGVFISIFGLIRSLFGVYFFRHSFIPDCTIHICNTGLKLEIFDLWIGFMNC